MLLPTQGNPSTLVANIKSGNLFFVRLFLHYYPTYEFISSLS